MSALLAALEQWRPFEAVVIGDVMLDEIVSGDADRLAADAPVPVLHVRQTERRPGGAANVAMDLAAMRGRVRCIGLVGQDEPGAALRSLHQRAGVDPADLVTDPGRPTTVKRSVVGLAQHRHAQKMFRLDYESRAPASAALASALLDRLDAALTGGARVVCLEDYGKGVCTPELCRGVIQRASARGAEVLVDPAHSADVLRYAGATAITPNRSEAEQAARALAMPARRPGHERAAPEDYADIAAALIDRLGLAAAVITLDKHGALLLEGRGEATLVPTVARQVYDVTGAGDMVLAALAAGRAAGLDWFQSVRLANAAAGLEVERFGVVPIPIEEIHRDVLARERSQRGKLRTGPELAVELRALRGPGGAGGAGGPRVVFANGCFDMLHAGHVSLLRRARAEGDYLVVAINDDAGVRALKGPGRPVHTQADRAEILAALECVDAVTIFSEPTPEALVRSLRPDVLVKGDQYDKAAIPGAAFVESIGGRVALLSVVPGRSTTATVSKVRAAGADTRAG
ncbi:MAG: bifunctional heptose 7-phosphate kinase/heptose 1-phosphate adenyltransferase [Isosphaera sp.]|nr:bifunctional heptose 7-phosphate kinase/heptose 1-phosphate adenyltransferase [Isosphaera sp.]